MPESEDMKELKEELRKLRPAARLKRLKELEEKRKVEMDDIEELIKDSEKDLHTEEVADDITPEQEELNIGRLFEEEAEELERTVRKEAPGKEEEDQKYLSFKQVYNDYAVLQDIAYASMEEGELTHNQMEIIDRIGERLDRSKYMTSSQEAANLLVASKSVLYKIKKYGGVEEGRRGY